MPNAKLTSEQCQFMLNAAVTFAPPDKLGDGTYGFIEKALAADEVRALYRVLRSYSPALQDSALNKRRIPVFGLVSDWEFDKDATGQPTGGRLLTPDKEHNIVLDDDSVSGIMWCLLLALHPDGRDHRVSVTVAENIVWPIAKRLSKVQALRDAIGLNKVEKRRRWDCDPVQVGD